MGNDRSSFLLGELLTDAGLLLVDDLREAANIARNQNLPIGKVLVMSGYISKELLQACVEAQARLKDGVLDYETALQAIKLVNQNNSKLDEALSQLNSPSAYTEPSNKLGELLLSACLIGDADLKKALLESNSSGLPLGRVLINLSMISEPLLKSALKAQTMLREGKISKEEAIKSLLVAKEEQLPYKNDKSDKSVCAPDNKILSPPNNYNGGFLATGQFRTTKSQLAPMPVDQSPNVSDPKKSVNNAKPPHFADLNALSLHHMLRVAGLVKTETLEKAIKDSLEDQEVMTAILRRSKVVEEYVIEAAKECCQLIKEGLIKPEQAIIALHHCQRTRNSIHDCLLEFGWLEQQSEMVQS